MFRSSKRLRRAQYGQRPSADGTTITIENGAGDGKDLTVGSGSVFNLGGNMRFGRYPTVGMTLPFLRKVDRCCGTDGDFDKCKEANARTSNLTSEVAFDARITTDSTNSGAKNTSGFVDGDICAAMGTGNCGTNISLDCNNFGLVNDHNRATLAGNHVVAIEIWQQDSVSVRAPKLQVLLAGDHTSKTLDITVDGNELTGTTAGSVETSFGADPNGVALQSTNSTAAGYTLFMPAEFTRFEFATGAAVAGQVLAAGKAIFDLFTSTPIGETKDLNITLKLY